MPCARCFPQWFVPSQCCLSGIEITSRTRCRSVLHSFGQAAMTEALATTPRVEYAELQRDHLFYLFYLVWVYTRIKLWSFVISDILQKPWSAHTLFGPVLFPCFSSKSVFTWSLAWCKHPSPQMLWSHLQRQSMAKKCLKKQDGNHEPECSHVILRWAGHNQITVHLSAFFSVLRWTTLLYNTCLQHSSPTLFYNTSLQQFLTTLFSNTLLQHLL